MNKIINDLSNKQRANIRAPASSSINIDSMYETYIKLIINFKLK